MTRQIGAGMVSMLATRAHTRANMIRLDLRDGTVIGLTDHDRPLAFDLGDGEIEYFASTGILPSALVLSEGFDSDNAELSGPISDIVTRDAVMGGRFDRARVRFFQTNWANPSDGAIPLMKGNVSDGRIEGGKFVLGLRSTIDRFNQDIGRLITPYCDADLGDARCKFDLIPVNATVTAVTDAMRFTVSFSGSYADDYFNLGTAIFTSGVLDGTAAIEIFDWTSAGVVTMWEPFADVPAIGDTLELRQGCAKTREACMAFDNILNFRGFPEVPGSDQVLKYAVPGDSGA